MTTVSFEQYCEEYCDQHLSLMSVSQRQEARAGYAKFISTSAVYKTDSQVRKHKKDLEKANSLRSLAKFFGGKALTGSAAQKKWAEQIRESFLKSDRLTEEEKQQLVTCGGFTNTAKFWIENRDVAASKMTAKNIVAQYRSLRDLQFKHADTLSRTGSTRDKDAARIEIENFRKSLDFKFED